MKRFLSLLCFLVMNHLGFSQDTIFTDRPTVTFSPNTMPKGWFQFEAGFQYQVSDQMIRSSLNSDVNVEDILYNNTLFRYAITNSLELRYTQNVSKTKIKRGGELREKTDLAFTPSVFGIKYNFLHFKDGGQRLSLLANYATELFDDTGEEDNVELLLLFHSPVFKRFGFDYNVGWDFSDGLNASNFKYSFLISKSLSSRFSAYLEGFGNIPKGEDGQFNFDGGAMYLLSNTMQIDMYAGTGFSDGSPNFIFGFGISKLFLPKQ